MKRWLKWLLSIGFYYSGIFVFTLLLRRLSGKRLSILTFHRVTSDEGCEGCGLPTINISQSNFQRLIDFVGKYFRVVSVEDILDRQNFYAQKWTHCALLTFDDGYEEVFSRAIPLLAERGFPSVLFIPTAAIDKGYGFWWDLLYTKLTDSTLILSKQIDKAFSSNAAIQKLGVALSTSDKERKIAVLSFIDELQLINPELRDRTLSCLFELLGLELEKDVSLQPKLLTWEKVKRCREQKMTVGAHTVNHEFLTSISANDALSEITESKDILERRLNGSVLTFSYPGGRYDEGTLRIMKKSSYHCAFTSDEGLNSVKTDIFQLKRINISDDNLVGPRGGFSRAIAAWALFFRW